MPWSGQLGTKQDVLTNSEGAPHGLIIGPANRLNSTLAKAASAALPPSNGGQRGDAHRCPMRRNANKVYPGRFHLASVAKARQHASYRSSWRWTQQVPWPYWKPPDRDPFARFCCLTIRHHETSASGWSVPADNSLCQRP
jgi:hypothetical protein